MVAKGSMAAHLRAELSNINAYYIDGAYDYAEKVPCKIKGFKNAKELFAKMEGELDWAILNGKPEEFKETMKTYVAFWFRLFERMAKEALDKKGLKGMTLREFRMLPQDGKAPVIVMSENPNAICDIPDLMRQDLVRNMAILHSRIQKKDAVMEGLNFTASEVMLLMSQGMTGITFDKIAAAKKVFNGSWLDVGEILKRV